MNASPSRALAHLALLLAPLLLVIWLLPPARGAATDDPRPSASPSPEVALRALHLPR